MLIDAITDARVPGHDGPCTLRLERGRVADVVDGPEDFPATAHMGKHLDASGRLVLPGFVDAHVHLDKAFLLDLVGPSAPHLSEAIRVVAEARGGILLEQVRAGAERAVDALVRHGVTAARAHVEIDPLVGLDFVHMHRALAESVADRIELQLVAFPQRGLELAGMTDWMRAAMNEGLAVVGGCPYVDADPERHVDFVFDLAEDYDAPIDLHLDFSDDPGRSLVAMVAERVRAHGVQGRVAIGHVTTLAAMDPSAQAATLELLAEAGIALIVLPATDLYLAGHGEPGTRSLAPLERARAAGVHVAIANNNLENPFAPFGNGNLLQAAWVTGLVRRAADPATRRWLYQAITREPAAILGLPPHGPELGQQAHLVVLDVASIDEAIRTAPPVLVTLRAGRLAYALRGADIT